MKEIAILEQIFARCNSQMDYAKACVEAENKGINKITILLFASQHMIQRN